MQWLHLVDLNGAFAGAPVNAAPVEAILKACPVPAQLGGGIRDMATIERWIDRENQTRKLLISRLQFPPTILCALAIASLCRFPSNQHIEQKSLCP